MNTRDTLPVGLIAALSLWAWSNPHGFFLPKIAVLVVGVFLWAIRRNRSGAVFFLAALTSACLSPMPQVSMLGFPGMYQGGVLALAFYLLLMEIPTDLAWLKWAGVALSVHALLQLAGLDPVIAKAALPSGHPVAWDGSHVDLGAILAMALPVAGPWWPLVGAGLLATGARGAWFGAAFALAPARLRWLMLPVFLVPFFQSAPKDKARVELWRIAAQGFFERPTFGYGPEMYKLVLESRRGNLDKIVSTNYTQVHPHNDILEVMCCLGILGLAAYLWFVLPMLACPSLLALFVYLKFDPVSFEVLCVAALVAAAWRAKNQEGEIGLP